jgi:hypothetical protein
MRVSLRVYMLVILLVALVCSQTVVLTEGAYRGVWISGGPVLLGIYRQPYTGYYECVVWQALAQRQHKTLVGLAYKPPFSLHWQCGP